MLTLCSDYKNKTCVTSNRLGLVEFIILGYLITNHSLCKSVSVTGQCQAKRDCNW